MAASKTRPKHTDSVFWTQPKMSSKVESVVPGVTDVGNLRPRVKGGKTKEVRASIPVVQPTVEDLDPQISKTSTNVTTDVSESMIDTETSLATTATIHGRKVSLKDLCVEDKKRVANLIKELAKVGEEKESAEKNLEQERKHYEDQILKLVEQQEQILKEREEVQKRLLDYQTYILKLQQDQQLQQLQQHQKNLLQKRKHHPEQNSPTTSDKVLKPNENRNNSSAAPKPAGFLPVNQDFMTPPTAGFDVLKFNKQEGSEVSDSEETPTAEPSVNFYMNEIHDETGTENFSTQVQPPLSPPAVLDSAKPRLPRPFTVMIDKELANQRHLLTHAGGQGENENLEYREAPGRQKEKKQNLSPEASGPKHRRDNRNVGNARAKSKYESHKNVVMEDVDNQTDTKHKEYNEEGVHEHFGTGNTHFLTPEKSELITRYMQSQSEIMKAKHDPESDMKNTHRKKTSSQEREKERTRKSKERAIRSKRKKRRKPPPPSYGPLHAPIMSSTQKSSEIRDYISVDSTINSDRFLKRNIGNEHDDEDDDSEEEYSTNSDSDPDVNNNNDDERRNNNNNRDRNPMGDTEEEEDQQASKKKKGKDKKKNGGAKVEFADKPAEKAVLGACTSGQIGVGDPFLEKYRKMSASERKAELLKQKSMLLDEQNRLKSILADQEYDLKLKQEAALSKMQQMESLDKDQKSEMKKIQLSLAQMEAELAQKEEELIKGRELLAKKRSEQARFQMETEKVEQASRVPSSSKSYLDKNQLRESTSKNQEATRLVVVDRQYNPEPSEEQIASSADDKQGNVASRSSRGENFDRHVEKKEKEPILIENLPDGLPASRFSVQEFTGQKITDLPAVTTSGRNIKGSSSKSSPRVSRAGSKNENFSAAVTMGKNDNSTAMRGESTVARHVQLFPLAEKQITGKDGDSCVVYQSSDSSDIVRKLDYSLHSDTETDVAKPETGYQKQDEANLIVSSNKEEKTPSKADAQTSISYHRLPGDNVLDEKKKSTTKQQVQGTRQKSVSAGARGRQHRKYPHSPGEKTLSVLEIINSMEGREPISFRNPSQYKTAIQRKSDKPDTRSHFSTLHQQEIPSSGVHHKGKMQKRPVPDRSSVPQFYSPLKYDVSESSPPKIDEVLELFTLKRSDGGSRGERKSRRERRRIVDDIDDLIDIHGSDNSHLDISGVYDDDDSNIDEMVKNLVDDDDDDVDYDDETPGLSVNDDVGNSSKNTYDDNGMVNYVLKTMGELRLPSDEQDDFEDDDENNNDDDDVNDSLSELEESKILEEVFFVI